MMDHVALMLATSEVRARSLIAEAEALERLPLLRQCRRRASTASSTPPTTADPAPTASKPTYSMRRATVYEQMGRAQISNDEAKSRAAIVTEALQRRLIIEQSVRSSDFDPSGKSRLLVGREKLARELVALAVNHVIDEESADPNATSHNTTSRAPSKTGASRVHEKQLDQRRLGLAEASVHRAITSALGFMAASAAVMSTSVRSRARR
jgi:hypothetical protein